MLVYSERLQKIINEKLEIQPGSREEIEIRGNSIYCVELLRIEIEKMVLEDKIEMNGQIVNAITIDFYFWDEAKKLQIKSIEAHRTRSIFY